MSRGGRAIYVQTDWLEGTGIRGRSSLTRTISKMRRQGIISGSPELTISPVEEWNLEPRPEPIETKKPKRKRKKGKKKPPEVKEERAFQLRDYLYKRILAWKPDIVKSEHELHMWAYEIDKMLRIDKRPWTRIKAVIDYATTDKFWRPNIMSGAKLRKQYDRLDAKAPGFRSGLPATPEMTDVDALYKDPSECGLPENFEELKREAGLNV